MFPAGRRIVQEILTTLLCAVKPRYIGMVCRKAALFPENPAELRI
jgi:hypothetical protein